MSTIAQTVAAMENMSEQDKNRVLVFAQYTLNMESYSNPDVTHTDEELVSMLNHSDSQYHQGQATERNKSERHREAELNGNIYSRIQL